ncbi:hypothetical protein ACJMK2_007230, partial [Sinanodonta woodiana]
MEENRDRLLSYLDTFEMEEIKTISNSCRMLKSLSSNVLIFFINQLIFIKTAINIMNKLCLAGVEHRDALQFQFLKTRLDDLKKRIIGDKTRRIHFTIQELRELLNEFLRLHLLAGCAIVNGKLMDNDIDLGEAKAIRHAIKVIEIDLVKLSGSMEGLRYRFEAHVRKIALNLIPETVRILYPVGYSADDWHICSY